MAELKETRTRAQGAGSRRPLKRPSRHELALNGEVVMEMEKNQELHWGRQIWNLIWVQDCKEKGETIHTNKEVKVINNASTEGQLSLLLC